MVLKLTIAQFFSSYEKVMQFFISNNFKSNFLEQTSLSDFQYFNAANNHRQYISSFGWCPWKFDWDSEGYCHC